MMRVFLRTVLLVVCFGISAAAAAEVRILLGQPVSAGSSHVDVFLLNEGAAPITAAAPDRMEKIIGGAQRVLVREDDAPGMLAPGAFVKVRYRIEPLAESAAGAGAPAAPVEDAAASGHGSEGFFGRFSSLEPVYALLGAGPLDAKVQVSAAYRLFSAAGPLGRLRLGFTQTLFWALSEPSLPFRSITYRPELIYGVPLQIGSVPVRFSAGLRHESNGESGEQNRSVNTLPMALSAKLDLGDEWSLEVRPEAWIFLNTADQNADIDDFRGHAGVQARLLEEEGLQIAARMIGSFDTGNGSLEVSSSYPLPALGAEGVGLYVMGQVFTGYGESLLDYNQRTTRVRLGLALVR